MRFYKYVIDEVCCDRERGIDEVGHWEEVNLSREQVKTAVCDFLRNEYTKEGDRDREEIVEKLFEEFDCRTEIEDAFKEEIESYYEGKVA